MPINFSENTINSDFKGRRKLKKQALIRKPALVWNFPTGELGNRWDVERHNNVTNFNISSNISEIEYYLSPGSSLPSGLNLSTDGTFTGVNPEVSSDTTYNFNVDAYLAGTKLETKQFSFVQKAPVIVKYTSPGTYTLSKPYGPTRVRVLLVGGAGGGGNNRGNGLGGYGGGGGIVYHNGHSVPINSGNYTIVVGSRGGSSCCNNQSGCSGGNTTGFGGTAARGGGGQSEYNGNCGGAANSTMPGATYLAQGRSGCGFGSNSGYATYSSDIDGTTRSYYAAGGPRRGDASGCGYFADNGQAVIRY